MIQDIEDYKNKIQSLEYKIQELQQKNEEMMNERSNYLELLDTCETSDSDVDELNPINDLSIDVQLTNQEELRNEDRIVYLGVKISRLQYEISECFHAIRDGIMQDQNEYERYKIEKRNFYKFVDTFYNIYRGENKLDVFDILIKILKKEKKIYQCDSEIEKLH